MTAGAKVLVTGATGFVGTHLVRTLRAEGYDVVSATREPKAARKKGATGPLVRVDLLDAASVRAALEGCKAAFYLVHGMADSDDYVALEARQAETFRLAAGDAGIERIVYLGGPMPEGEPSKHLKSRLQTGEILRRGPVPTLELQASMVIGARSESFRMVRDLAARLPIMILPEWLSTRTEPVAVDDVTFALTHALSIPLQESRIFALPGPEILSGKEILMRTAQAMDLSPWLLRVPFVTPRLSSLWIRWVTRADSRVAAQLVQGLRHDLIAKDDGFWTLFPNYTRLTFDEAVRRALRDEGGPISLRARLGERLAHRIAGAKQHSTRGAHN